MAALSRSFPEIDARKVIAPCSVKIEIIIDAFYLKEMGNFSEDRSES
jgi:hypothetical protein